MIIGIGFIDLSVAYDTANHRFLIQIFYNTMQDSTLCRINQNMLSNIIFYVKLNNEHGQSGGDTGVQYIT